MIYYEFKNISTSEKSGLAQLLLDYFDYHFIAKQRFASPLRLAIQSFSP
jgi:hypothetical protein